MSEDFVGVTEKVHPPTPHRWWRVLTFPTIRHRHARQIAALVLIPRLLAGLLALSLLNAPYLALRGIADDTGVPHQREYVLAFDRVLGFGATPTERLQDLLFVGELRAFEWLFIVAYVSFFFAPLALATYLVVTRWRLFPQFLVVCALTQYTALVVFLALPTEPPWLALGVTRIIELRETAPVQIDPNQLAAFPSLHVGLPAAFAFWLWSVRIRSLAWAFAAVTAGVAFAVVYFGEHYVVDVIAGIAIGFAAAWIAPIATRRRPVP